MCGVFLSADRLAVFTPSFIRFNECDLFFSPLLLHTLRETHMSLPSREALWSGMERVKECNLTQMETASRLHSEALNRFKPLQVTLIMTYDLKSEESWRKGGVGRPTKGKEESKWGTCGSLACTMHLLFISARLHYDQRSLRGDLRLRPQNIHVKSNPHIDSTGLLLIPETTEVYGMLWGRCGKAI